MRSKRIGAVLVAVICIAVGFALWSRQPASDMDRVLASGEKLYSQRNEELVIRHFFEDRRGGSFLDVGSGHYENHSTTYYLEKHLGWTGIGIDAVPDYADDYAKHRPGTRFFNLLVSDHSGSLEPFYQRGPQGNWGLSSTERILIWQGREWKGKEIELQTVALTDLLDELGVTEIDFMSMDIEGAELKALSGLDIERFAPEFVCIEAGGDEEHRRAIAAYFAEHGYERVDKYRANDIWNWYYARKL